MKSKNLNVNLEGLRPEQRAYIYQQINEFTPFFLPDSDVEVRVQRNSDDKGKPFSVVFVLTGGGGFIQSEGRDANIYEAVKKAKNAMLAHLYSVQQKVTSSDEREEEIELIKKSGGIH